MKVNHPKRRYKSYEEYRKYNPNSLLIPTEFVQTTPMNPPGLLFYMDYIYNLDN